MKNVKYVDPNNFTESYIQYEDIQVKLAEDIEQLLREKYSNCFLMPAYPHISSKQKSLVLGLLENRKNDTDEVYCKIGIKINLIKGTREELEYVSPFEDTPNNQLINTLKVGDTVYTKGCTGIEFEYFPQIIKKINLKKRRITVFEENINKKNKIHNFYMKNSDGIFEYHSIDPSLNIVTPASPDEILNQANLPNFVITAINEAIKDNYRGFTFTITQKELLEYIMKYAPADFTVKEIFEKKYLDFERIYEKFGWEVSYESPSYRESFEEFFTFKKK